ncbi:aromatic acid exporter family protein [Nocardiopsis salina]|uniref:aromatic acid exporter family protein n=1 Tax=Nocardiopsis salina TaxID=245836 RepID=UPI0030845C95
MNTVWSRAKQGLERAVQLRGYERETAVLIIKSAVAATIALAAGFPLDPQGSFIGFAPFSALLIVQPSVYGSVLQSGRYVAAVALGAVLAGVGGLTVGVQVWAFAMVVLVGLILGQVRFFGQQGQQVPVVAAFALAGGTATSIDDLGHLLLMVGVGAVSALATNLVMAPTIRFKDAENAVLDYADSMHNIVDGLADELRGDLEESSLDHWAWAANALDDTSRNARAAVERQEYRVRLNPRRFLGGAGTSGYLSGYRTWISVLERSSRHLQSIAESLQDVRGGYSEHIELSEGFCNEYADLLESTADVLQTVHDEQEPNRETVSDRLSSCLDQALDRVSECRQNLMNDPGEEEPARAALLTDVVRLLEEIDRGRQYSGQSG